MGRAILMSCSCGRLWGRVAVEDQATPVNRGRRHAAHRGGFPQALTRPRPAAVSKTGPGGMRVRIAAIWW